MFQKKFTNGKGKGGEGEEAVVVSFKVLPWNSLGVFEEKAENRRVVGSSNGVHLCTQWWVQARYVYILVSKSACCVLTHIRTGIDTCEATCEHEHEVFTSLMAVREINRLLHCASKFAQTLVWSDIYALQFLFENQIRKVECRHFIILTW